MGIRLAVLDDNPHLAWDGRIYPKNALFHRFLAALLDVPGAPVAEVLHITPVRAAASRPETGPVDARIRTVPTAPFAGIAGYLLRAPILTIRNARPIRDAIRETDLLLMRLPASNAPLTAVTAARLGRPRFGYVAGSARDVAAALPHRGPSRWAAIAVGAAYDAVSRRAAGRDHTIATGERLLDGGVVTSLVEADEIGLRGGQGRAGSGVSREAGGGLRLAWSGRLVQGKGVETLIDALAALNADPSDSGVSLAVLGDGPHREALMARAAAAGLDGAVTWMGHVGDRATYLDTLGAADLFVFPSPAEGFPKVVLDAAAVGLPVLASPVGALSELAASGILVPVPPSDPAVLAAAVRDLAGDTARRSQLRDAGLRFAAEHTRPAEAARLVARLRTDYPSLPWS
jgi:glycosyltransferase involved in cell wall biosynthesis